MGLPAVRAMPLDRKEKETAARDILWPKFSIAWDGISGISRGGKATITLQKREGCPSSYAVVLGPNSPRSLALAWDASTLDEAIRLFDKKCNDYNVRTAQLPPVSRVREVLEVLGMGVEYGFSVGNLRVWLSKEYGSGEETGHYATRYVLGQADSNVLCGLSSRFGLPLTGGADINALQRASNIGTNPHAVAIRALDIVLQFGKRSTDRQLRYELSRTPGYREALDSWV